MGAGPDGVSAFESIADQYAASRPGYPPAVFDAIEELCDRPLRDARLIDVGAGTGIATALFRERGARVIAVEPGAAMAGRFGQALPGIPVIRAVGEALPIAPAVADLISYAQSWHWTDPARSVGEAVRVLRRGGALVLFWNTVDPEVDWAVGQEHRLGRFAPKPDYPGVHPGYCSPVGTVADVLARCDPNLRPAVRRLRWTRPTPIRRHLTYLASRSDVAALSPPAAAQLLSDEETVLRDLFPSGVVDEAYVVELVITRV